MQNVYNAIELKDKLRKMFKNRNEQYYKILPTLGISKNTLDKDNTSMPKLDTLAVIADYLDVSIDSLLNRQVSTPELSETESELLSLFRACPDADKENIILLARSFAEREAFAKEKENVSK